MLNQYEADSRPKSACLQRREAGYSGQQLDELPWGAVRGTGTAVKKFTLAMMLLVKKRTSVSCQFSRWRGGGDLACWVSGMVIEGDV